MAKARNLAALAGLAGLAFANRDKLFGSKDKSSGMTGAQNDALANANTQRAMTGDQNDTLARVNREAATGQTDINAAIRKSPAFAPKEAPSVTAPAAPAPKSEAAPVKAAPVKPKPKVVMTGAQNDALARANRSTGMSNAQNDALAKANQSTKKPTPATNTAATSTPAAKTTPAAKPTPAATPAKSSGRVPTSEEAAANRQALYDKVTSGVGGYLNDTFTLEGRERAKKAASGMKRGGSVKMASGGMTASRRGDGIAARGKTRGKLC